MGQEKLLTDGYNAQRRALHAKLSIPHGRRKLKLNAQQITEIVAEIDALIKLGNDLGLESYTVNPVLGVQKSFRTTES